MKPEYRSYQLDENYSTDEYCKLYANFPCFFLGCCSTEGSALPKSYKAYDKLVAGGFRKLAINPNDKAFDQLENGLKNNNAWCFGYFGYDLKNQLENLSSDNTDYLGFEDVGFFYPAFVFIEKNGKTILHINEEEYSREALLALIKNSNIEAKMPVVKLQELCSKKDYLAAIENIKEKIIHGDVYEINFCRAWQGHFEELKPESVFLSLNKLSKAPFASLFKMDDLTVIGASPERFLRKEGKYLLSQPIKGTRKRSKDLKLDNVLKQELLESKKERAENVMIVDLVRNDLSKFAARGSVKVEELYGIYTFEQVHQMISGVSAELADEENAIKAIAGAFPMGSMTGAPKISAMKIIEEYENFKRGIYSGSIGYFDMEGNFDFNVVIRSIIINTRKAQLLFAAGGAITQLSNAEEEFEETLVKARALAAVLGHNL